MRVLAAAATAPAATIAAGSIVVSPSGGQPLRVPWTIAFEDPPRRTARPLGVSPRSFAPSDTSPAQLRVVVGALPGGARLEVEPVARLEIRLFGPGGTSAPSGLRTSLPGRWDRDHGPPAGVLPAGTYALSLLAWPTLGGRPSRARVSFRIE